VSSSRRRRPAVLLRISAVVGLLAAGCHPAPALLPPPPATVEVSMSEYRFDHRPVPAGRVVFRLGNVGRIPHRFALVPLPEDFPPIEQQLHGEEREVVEPLASVPDVPPGGRGIVAADVKQGRWAMICFIVDPDGTSHALKGMATEFRIR